MEGAIFSHLFSLVIKTKVVHNINRMAESQPDRQTESDTQKVRQSENQNNRATKESALVHLPKHWVQN